MPASSAFRTFFSSRVALSCSFLGEQLSLEGQGQTFCSNESKAGSICRVMCRNDADRKLCLLCCSLKG